MSQGTGFFIAPTMLPACSFLRLEKAGSAIIDLHVSPNAKQTAITGLHDGALALRLKAAPVDGKANAALLAWLAAQLQVPRGALELVRGQTTKRKQFRLAAGHVAQARWQHLLPPAERAHRNFSTATGGP